MSDCGKYETNPIACILESNVVLGIDGTHCEAKVLLSSDDAHLPSVDRLFGS